MKVKIAEKTAAKTAKNEPARAKPAPGPDVGVGLPRHQQHENDAEQQPSEFPCASDHFFTASFDFSAPLGGRLILGLQLFNGLPGLQFLTGEPGIFR